MSSLLEADPWDSWWPYIISGIVVCATVIRSWMGGKLCPTNNTIRNSTVIVTGGNSGIGLALVRELAVQRHAKIIMACRDLVTAKKTVTEITKKHPNIVIDCKELDLSSFASVKSFVHDIETEYDKIDVLINNAGVIFNPYEETEDGLESHLQINYLSNLLLTFGLMPLLNKSPQGRVIFTSAHAYQNAKLNIDDPLNIKNSENNYDKQAAFANSKFALVAATQILAKNLRNCGSRVTVNVYTPGLVRGTRHLRRSAIMNAISARVITFPWMWLFMKNAKQGAQTALYLTIEPKLSKISGAFFNDCEQTDVNDVAKDETLNETIYIESLKVLGLSEKLPLK